MKTSKSSWNMPKAKYRNRKIHTPDGIFDSEHEFNRWGELKMLEKNHEIVDLKRQVKFELIPTQKIGGKVIERSCSYIADFTYYYKGDFVVEDAKGMKTPEYIIKRKLMLKVFGIRVQEV